jgi:hypothetical protein
MARTRKAKRSRASKLVRYGGKVVTIGHAAKCVGKGFKGCTAAEINAIVEVVQRLAKAAKRR